MVAGERPTLLCCRTGSGTSDRVIYCGREQVLQDSIQAELRKVRARADFETAYLRRIMERRAQCEARSLALRQDVAARFATEAWMLRDGCILAL